MSVEINLSRRVDVFPKGVTALSLSFRGDLSKVDYAGADARLAAEMDRHALPARVLFSFFFICVEKNRCD